MTLVDSDFADSDLQQLYENGADPANAIPASLQGRCLRLLDALAAATSPTDLGYEKVTSRNGTWYLSVDGSRSIVFNWKNGSPVDIRFH